MKNISLILSISVLLITGCSQPYESKTGKTGNDLELTGTWSAFTKIYNTLNLTPATNKYEGTWEYKDVDYPNSTYTSIINGKTYTTYYDTTVTTTTYKKVISADGSYIFTKIISAETFAREAVAPVQNASTYTAGYEEIANKLDVETIVKTATVTISGGTYKERVVTEITKVTDSAEVVTNKIYYDETSETGINGLSFRIDPVNPIHNLGDDAMIQTVRGTTLPAVSSYDNDISTTYTLVVDRDGTYTLETVKILNVDAKPAIEASSTTSATLAVNSGTQVSTIISSGTLTSGTLTAGPTNLFLSQTLLVTSRVGTGSQISNPISNNDIVIIPAYPETAITLTQDYSIVIIWTVEIIKSKEKNAETRMIVNTGDEILVMIKS